MKRVLMVLLLGGIFLSPHAQAGKTKTTLAKAFARDSSTTISRFTVDRIDFVNDTTIRVWCNGGDVIVPLYDSTAAPNALKSAVQKITQDVKVFLEK